MPVIKNELWMQRWLKSPLRGKASHFTHNMCNFQHRFSQYLLLHFFCLFKRMSKLCLCLFTILLFSCLLILSANSFIETINNLGQRLLDHNILHFIFYHMQTFKNLREIQWFQRFSMPVLQFMVVLAFFMCFLD